MKHQHHLKVANNPLRSLPPPPHHPPQPVDGLGGATAARTGRTRATSIAVRVCRHVLAAHTLRRRQFPAADFSCTLLQGGGDSVPHVPADTAWILFGTGADSVGGSQRGEEATPFLGFCLLPTYDGCMSDIFRQNGVRGIWINRDPATKPDLVLYYAHGEPEQIRPHILTYLLDCPTDHIPPISQEVVSLSARLTSTSNSSSTGPPCCARRGTFAPPSSRSTTRWFRTRHIRHRSTRP
jgi:hypothetical protein